MQGGGTDIASIVDKAKRRASLAKTVVASRRSRLNLAKLYNILEAHQDIRAANPAEAEDYKSAEHTRAQYVSSIESLHIRYNATDLPCLQPSMSPSYMTLRTPIKSPELKKPRVLPDPSKRVNGKTEPNAIENGKAPVACATTCRLCVPVV